MPLPAVGDLHGELGVLGQWRPLLTRLSEPTSVSTWKLAKEKFSTQCLKAITCIWKKRLENPSSDRKWTGPVSSRHMRGLELLSPQPVATVLRHRRLPAHASVGWRFRLPFLLS